MTVTVTATATVTMTVKDVRSLGEIRIVRAEHVSAGVKSRCARARERKEQEARPVDDHLLCCRSGGESSACAPTCNQLRKTALGL